MRPHIIANFPASFSSYFDTSIMRIAREKELFTPQFYNLGDFSLQAQHRIDDKPYGGGAGALIEMGPMYRAITSIETALGKAPLRKIYLGPGGKRLVQSDCEKLSREFVGNDLVILCGHYEGVDHRIFEMFEFEQYSIGDFVISSGELATMVFLDALVRLIPGVVGNSESLKEESFSAVLEGKKEYPQYTRPSDFMGYKVPEVLLSGNPKKIQEWRNKHSH